MKIWKAALIALYLLLWGGRVDAWMVSIEPHYKGDKRNGGVIFPIQNNTRLEITTLYGWVYGYNGDSYERFQQVASQNRRGEVLGGKAHPAGKTAYYWFPVPDYLLGMKDYGIIIYDRAIRFRK